jgi:hypothetical protein
MNDIKKGIYKHYKGKEYEVLGVVRHSETLDILILYKALYQAEGENLWVRPKAMFFEKVTVEGVEMDRFQYIRTA